MIERKTILSDDRVYRYTLWREWWKERLPRPPCRDCADSHGTCPHDGTPCDPTAFVQFICLNPSTADETKDDPTIRKCVGFAKRWGYGALCMTNLFAFRATNPKLMRLQRDPVGEKNTLHLVNCASEAALVIAAWGCRGDHLDCDDVVKEVMSKTGVNLKCLRKTAKGHPEHPLYITYETQLIEFQ